MKAARAVLVLALLAPTASALDALPDAARLGPSEGVVVVRSEGAIRVQADAPLEVALEGDAFVAAPASLDPAGRPRWRGLEGAVELRFRRADPHQEVRVELDDGATGVVIEWPAEARTPLPAALALAALGVGALVRRAFPR